MDMNRLAFCLAIACCAFGVVAQQRVETAAECARAWNGATNGCTVIMA